MKKICLKNLWPINGRDTYIIVVVVQSGMKTILPLLLSEISYASIEFRAWGTNHIQINNGMELHIHALFLMTATTQAG